MNIKICSKCKRILLDQIDFSVHWHNQNEKYYYRTECNKCEYNRGKINRLNNPEKHLACVKRYQSRNKEKVKAGYRNYYYRKYESWVTYLKELGYTKCSKCGYDKCFAALEFHHTNNSKTGGRESTISSITSKAFTEKNKQLLLKELQKCVILCSNCHRELHYEEGRKQ